MTTIQYIKKFKLDDANYSNHFNTDLFLQDLNEEFLARIEREKAERKKAGLEYSFRIFQVIIQEMQNKFCAISNKKVGGPLRPELWNAFYAKYIITVREKDFPEEHAKIQAKREAYEKNTIREKLIEEYGRDDYAQLKALAKLVGYKKDHPHTVEFNRVKDEIEAEVEKRYKAKQEELANKKAQPQKPKGSKGPKKPKGPNY